MNKDNHFWTTLIGSICLIAGLIISHFDIVGIIISVVVITIVLIWLNRFQ